MRLILHKDLIGLGNIKGVANLSASQFSNFLVPVDAINVGELVKLVDTVILEKRIAEETPQPKPEAREISERQVATVKRSELRPARDQIVSAARCSPHTLYAHSNSKRGCLGEESPTSLTQSIPPDPKYEPEKHIEMFLLRNEIRGESIVGILGQFYHD